MAVVGHNFGVSVNVRDWLFSGTVSALMNVLTIDNSCALLCLSKASSKWCFNDKNKIGVDPWFILKLSSKCIEDFIGLGLVTLIRT